MLGSDLQRLRIVPACVCGCESVVVDCHVKVLGHATARKAADGEDGLVGYLLCFRAISGDRTRLVLGFVDPRTVVITEPASGKGRLIGANSAVTGKVLRDVVLEDAAASVVVL